jgi:hypothetical protein
MICFPWIIQWHFIHGLHKSVFRVQFVRMLDITQRWGWSNLRTKAIYLPRIFMKILTIYVLFPFWMNIIILFFVVFFQLKVHQDLLLTSLSFQLFGKVKHFVFLDTLKITNRGSVIQLTVTFCSQHAYVKLCYPFFSCQQATNSKTLVMTDWLYWKLSSLNSLATNVINYHS